MCSVKVQKGSICRPRLDLEKTEKEKAWPPLFQIPALATLSHTINSLLFHINLYSRDEPKAFVSVFQCSLEEEAKKQASNFYLGCGAGIGI